MNSEIIFDKKYPVDEEGNIQIGEEIIKIVDSNTAAVEKASQEKTHKTKKNKKS